MLQVWMAPAGDDAASGRSRAEPVRTLARVQAVVEEAAGPGRGLGEPVEVRLEPGVYADPAELEWRYFDEVHPTSFLPADYEDGWTAEDVAAAGGRPTLDGGYRPGFGFYFMLQRRSATGNTNLRLAYLQFQRYIKGGIHIGGLTAVQKDGRTVPARQTANRNRFSGLRLTLLGDYHAPNAVAPEVGYAGIGMTNSSGNVIEDCAFDDLRNASVHGGDQPGLIHGLYLSHNSEENIVRDCRFTRISGDAVRFRNGSSRNRIEGATFTLCGEHGHITDWYRVRGYYDTYEVRSWNNVARDVRFVSRDPNAKPGFCDAYCYDLPTACPPPANRIRVVR